jgi:hypothetical protein
MRYLFISIIAAFATYLSTYKLCNCGTNPILEELDQLAQSKGMEFVIGDKFPVLNPYGSYGSTYVFDFAYGSKNNPIRQSALFLCRKKSYVKEYEEAIFDLLNNYCYFLVFAIKTEDESKFKIQDIIPNVDLKGMSLYYGALNNIDLAKLEYVNKPNIIVPEEIRSRAVNRSIPVLISAESSTWFLFYYQGEWLEYVERDI